MTRLLTAAGWMLALAIAPARAAERLVKDLHPAGGGYLRITLSACSGADAMLNGSIENHTDSTWLYIEVQVKVTTANSTTPYRLNLERIGSGGGNIRQRIEGAAGQDCNTIRLSDIELIAAKR